MEKLSGLILDIYDDQEASVLKSIWPSADQLPDMVKTAQKITPELAEKIPDDLYALVIHDGDVTLRKYACVDAGNTALSVEYFFKTGHKLPREAQKTAAANLKIACGWYGIEPPEELEKVAIGVGTVLGAMAVPGIARDASAGAKAARAAGGRVMTPAQMQMMKTQIQGPPQ